MAPDSVRFMPIDRASSRSNNVCFSEWSAHAVEPNAGRVHRVVERDVVAVGARGPETVNAACLEPTVGLDLVEQLLRVAEELARGRALRRAVQDRRVFALELPGVEEERPVDVLAQLGELRLDHLPAHEGRLGKLAEREQQPPGPRVGQGQKWATRGRVLRTQLLLQGGVFALELPAAAVVEQV